MRVPQADLPLRCAAPLTWLPDETLYSAAARYHVLSGHPRPETTSRLLFGSRRGGFPHALPRGVSYFADITDFAFGDARSLLMRHTLLPQLLATRPFQVQHAGYRAMEGNDAGASKIKATLGLMASGQGAALPLKACRACLDEDRRRSGTGYWRLGHQLLGVWVCPDHGCLLQMSHAMACGRARYNWILPHEQDLVAAVPPEQQGPVLLERLQSLAEVASWLYRIALEQGVDHAALRQAVYAGLAQHGLLHPEGRLRQGKVGHQLVDYFQPTQCVLELKSLANSPVAAYEQ